MKLFAPLSVAASWCIGGAVAAELVEQLDVQKYESNHLLRSVPAALQLNWEDNDDDVVDSTDDVSDLKFAPKLQKDSERFIHDLKKWTAEAVGDVDGAELVVDTEFTLESEGNQDLDKPCGDLVAHKTFQVIKSFLKHPKHAKFDDKTAKKIMWTPSEECVYRHNSIEIDGGAHVNFAVSCGDDVLLTAAAATGGVSKKIFWHTVEAKGAYVAVDVLNGTVTVAAASGNLTPDVKFKEIPEDLDAIYDQLQQTIRDCAADKQLHIRGVVGGGWRQKYTEYGSFSDDVETNVLGYADAFDIYYRYTTVDSGSSVDITGSDAPATDASASAVADDASRFLVDRCPING